VASLFETGRITEVVLLVMVAELAGLVWLARRGVIAARVVDLAVSLGAGAALVMAVRAALVDEPWQVVALWLLVALAAHLSDLNRRFAPFGRATPRGPGHD
jgi:hypothetical protein